MRAFLSKLSLIGVHSYHNRDQIRDIRTLNAVNLIYLFIFTLIGLLDLTLLFTGRDTFTLSTINTTLIAIFALSNMFLVSRGKVFLIKLVIILLFPFLLLIFPVLSGDIINEYFFWYPYIPSVLTIIPHFFYRNQWKYLYISIGVYLVFVLFSDSLLLNSARNEPTIAPIVRENLLFIRISSLGMFIFINAAILYYLHQSHLHEKWIEIANSELEEQREELRTQNEKLSEQRHALSEKNHELEQLLFQLKTAQSQLIQSEKMASLGTLTSGVAHEINNPLNYISAGLQTMDSIFDELKKAGTSESERTLLINKCIKTLPGSILGVERISRIVRSLLSFSESSQSHQTNIHKVIDSTLMIVGFKIPKNVVIEKHFNEDLPEINIQQDRLHQALLAIIDNAVDAIKKQDKKSHKIIFRTYAEDSKQICLSISNSGPLIDNGIISKIYDPFFTTKDAGEGIGLGLTIAYNNIVAIQGDITAANKESLVEFTIRLPLTGKQLA